MIVEKQPIETAGPPCERCQGPTTWVQRESVHDQPVDVFRCEHCDQLSAEASSAMRGDRPKTT